MVNYEIKQSIAVLTMSSPPVNALGKALRIDLVNQLQRAFNDHQAKAILLISDQPLFSAGADIEEFATGRLWDEPDLHFLIDLIENSEKPVVSSIHGFAMGGAFEIALACDYRIASQGAKMGLPEIKIGVFPGAGGTQRLPRIAGLRVAVEMILSGNPIDTERALACGLLDRVIDGTANLLELSISYVSELLETQAPLRKCKDRQVNMNDIPDNYFSDIHESMATKFKGHVAHEFCLNSIELSTQLPLINAIQQDKLSFAKILETPQARALNHLFFAEREATKIPGLNSSTQTREIQSVAIIGAGTMGTGIAIACLDGGLPVTLLEMSDEALGKGVSRITDHYDRLVAKGRMDADKALQLKSSLTGVLEYSALAEVDLVIEAAFEDMEIKKTIFKRLSKICKQGAILASNTSTLDLNEIAQVTDRKSDVIGLHFFSPANIMRLLEIVRGRNTAAEVIKTALKLAKRIHKVPVVVGVCYGFVGNRMLEPYFREGSRLLLEGATPEQVDRVLTDFGMAMGIPSVSDLAGIDVGYCIRESRRDQISHDPTYHVIQDKLYELGRYGQKTGRGHYYYQGRDRISDPEINSICEMLALEHGIQRREISDDEILQRCLYPLINEAVEILQEGIAYRSGDCDIVWVNGYGFPNWRGGPLHYADEIGLDKVLAGMRHYQHSLGDYGAIWFHPALLLETLVSRGEKLADYISHTLK